jgi:hypothetical protein
VIQTALASVRVSNLAEIVSQVGRHRKESTHMTQRASSGGTHELLRQQSTTCETVKEIVDIAATAEALAVTLLGAAIESAQNHNLALNGEQIQVLQAARITEQAHFDYLVSAGAAPLSTSFTIPDPAIATDVATFLTTLIGLEEAFIAAYMAAAQVFAMQNQPDLVRVALQIGAVEADHRAHARFYAIAAGVISGVPNNLAFEQAKFSSVGEASAALQQLGFIGGTGPEINFPGPGDLVNPGVTNLQP